ncbi:MAG TPA: GNAT family N-acetyltransferase [Propioniciclava sp.]|uniref:GNAT family N-acetyltransferase n=3 Tax=Propioniciclava sp. TaxID=2038686 RepID=UPI002B9D256C|nr:GNAT family N-acetyltransferase [Propioniciclava sp.]HRL47795.1 GNAT family N-acetyltransferase [Propioniciclava sp.]
MSDVRFDTVPVLDPASPQMRAWQDAVRLGFGAADAPDEALPHWVSDIVADGLRLDAAFSTATLPGVAPELDRPVATFGSATLDVNTGARHEPTLFIFDVTVRTTHRRRGILKRLMIDALTRAKQEGLTLAALTASEATIYGRFGFGVATRRRGVTLATRPAPAWRREAPPRIALVSPADGLAIRDAVFARFHATTRGSHQRPHGYTTMLSGAWDYDKDAPVSGLRVAVHTDEAGVPDGVVSYIMDESDESLRVWDLVAADDAAELSLWQFLGSIDLVQKVTWRHLRPDSPLEWALADPRTVTTTAVGDFTWLRVLDTPGALTARGWETDGSVAFSVVDPLGFAAGTWRLTVSGGVADVAPLDAATVSVDVTALASLYFGLVDARTLAASGLIDGPSADVDALARLFRTSVPPYNLAGF